jgi:uncharacterized protein (TIGR02300 family)
MMGRPQLGTKCTCGGCSERFYDLNRSPAICPKCGAEQQPEKPRVVRPSRGSAFGTRPFARQGVAVAAAVADDDVEPASSSDVEDEEDAVESEDETDDDIEINPDHAKVDG